MTLEDWATSEMAAYAYSVSCIDERDRIVFKEEEQKTQMLAKIQLLKEIIELDSKGAFKQKGGGV